jgi:hypothetical protein
MFLQSEGLPFSTVLSRDSIAGALREFGLTLTEPVYSALVTTWVFLSQVISADGSCNAAVARLLAHRHGRGQPACSANTGGYCTARKRVPEGFFAHLARRAGSSLDENTPTSWRWKGRPVSIFDGSTVSMPDTPANQKAYAQPRSQKPGVGFPLARIGVLFSLAAGSVLDLGICPFRGKGNSELGLLRQLWHNLTEGAVLLADRYICSYFEIVLLAQRGVDAVCRLHQGRHVNWRDGDDQTVAWSKPRKPFWMPQSVYEGLPPTMTMRLVRVKVTRRGFRTRELHLATTLIDADRYTLEDLIDLYRTRWHAELDLRSLKTVMQMDVLRGQTPDIVHKEIWMHLLAYNLIRTVMAQAARKYDVPVRTISFKGTLQTLQAFQSSLQAAQPGTLPDLADIIWQAVVTHRVGQRPNRREPRARKRRPKPYPLLQQPRAIARKQLLYNE